MKGCLLLVGCSKAGNLEKYYSIEASNDGWSLEEYIIRVQDGELIFENGDLSVNGNFELFEIEIYQENKAGNKDTIFVESCSIVEEINLNRDFKDIQIRKESIDINSELKAEIKVNIGVLKSYVEKDASGLQKSNDDWEFLRSLINSKELFMT